MKFDHRGNCVLVRYTPNKGEADGNFDEDNGRIYINSQLSLLERECVYYHEVSHRECFDRKCECCKSEYRCEYHAMKGESQKVAARGSIQLNRAYLKNVRRSLLKYRASLKLWKNHFAALKRLMATKAFKSLQASLRKS